MRRAPLLATLAALALTGCAGVGVGSHSGADIGTVSADERITDPAVQRAAVASAEEAMASGRIAMAADLLRRAYEGSPNPALAARRSQAMRAIGQGREAQTFLLAASERFPNDLTLTTELVRSSLDVGDLANAAKATAAMMDSRGVGFTQYQVAGAYHARQNDVAKADALFAQAEAVAPGATERGNAQANRAMLLAQGGDVAGARARLETIAASASASPRVWAALAVMRSAAGDVSGASDAARRSGMSSADSADLSRWMGNAPSLSEMGAGEERPRPRPRRRPAPRQAAVGAETSQTP